MKNVLLTNNGSLYGKRILKEFNKNNIVLSAIVVVLQPISYYWKLFRYVQRKVGVSDAIYFAFIRSLRRPPVEKDLRDIAYEEFSENVFYVRGTNSQETIKSINAISPDLLILGQTGIVHKKILSIPKVGTLNAHPGILPEYRGIDCPKWTVFQKEFDKLGCTVHWVDSGVDTGDIVAQETYQLKGNESLDDLEDRYINNLCVSKLSWVVKELNCGRVLTGVRQNGGKQYYKMSRKYEKVAMFNLLKFRGDIPSVRVTEE